MRTASAKDKGRRLQRYVVNLILKVFPTLHQDDVRSTSMGASGEDIQLSPEARKFVPYSIECKNQERVNIWSAWKQVQQYGHEPLLIITRNRHDQLAILRAEEFFALLGRMPRGEDL